MATSDRLRNPAGQPLRSTFPYFWHRGEKCLFTILGQRSAVLIVVFYERQRHCLRPIFTSLFARHAKWRDTGVHFHRSIGAPIVRLRSDQAAKQWIGGATATRLRIVAVTGDGGANALTIPTDHSVGAGQQDSLFLGRFVVETKGVIASILITIFAASTLGCSAKDLENKEISEKSDGSYGYSSSFDSFTLSSDELKRAEEKAIAGDMDNLRVVVDYYTYSSPSFEDGFDKGNVLKWTELGASRGNVTYISNYLLFSVKSEEPCNKISKYFNILKERNPEEAKDRSRGHVRECLYR